MIPWINSSPITLEYAEEILLMADTGRCAVLDVSEVPKDRPTGQSSNFVMMVLGKRFCWNGKSFQSIPLLPLQCIAIVGLPESAKLRLIAQGGTSSTNSTRRHKEHKEDKEKPSFRSELQDLFVGVMTKSSEISVKHFEHFDQSGRETNLEKQVLNCQTMKFTALGEICVNTCKPLDQLCITPTIDRWLRVHLPQHGKALCVETGGRLHMEWDPSSGEGSLAVHKCESGQF